MFGGDPAVLEPPPANSPQHPVAGEEVPSSGRISLILCRAPLPRCATVSTVPSNFSAPIGSTRHAMDRVF